MPDTSFLPQHIEAYALRITEEEPPLLARLRRDTHLKALYPRMLSSVVVGRLMAMLSRLMRPRRILEVGTYTGYSALCLAEGLAPEGRLITLELNPELQHISQPYFREAGREHQIEQRLGDALQLIPQLNESLDLVFIDADKGSYPAYYDMLLPKMRQGGLLLADNVLWSGKVT
ncbi:MAG: O-methyltransferase, partial [Bacteroidetes bacterium]